jgi:hypothetical protein
VCSSDLYLSNKNDIAYGDYYEEYFTNDYFITYKYLSFCIIIDSDDKISFTDIAEEEAKEKITAVYDRFLNSNHYEKYLEYEERNHEDVFFSVVDTKKGLSYSTMTAGTTDEEVLSHEYGFIVKNGVLTCSKGFEGLLADNIDAKTGKCGDFDENLEYRLYVDEYNAYAGYNAAISNALKSADTNLLRSAILAGVLALAALIFAVISFVICGKKDKNGKIKRAFIDKVPTDLHLALTVGAQIGLSFLFAFVFDTILNFAYPFERYLYFAVYGIAALMWALLIEFLTSFIRVCRSEKKVYQNTLLYLIIKYIIIKPCGFLFRNLKSLFAYQPANFKKSLRAIIIGYGFLNAFFLFLMFLCVMINAPGGFGFLFLLSVGINIALFVFIVRYIKTLDTIITAAHFRQPPQVDYNKLPNSLKTLVNSLNYTRTELQNAVDKAVRDERMRTELITNVSHDLKTPLTSIITYVDLLKNCDIENEDAKEYIAVLDEKGIRLKRLIDDLIEASKITSGVINVESINLNLSELATQAVVEHQQEFADNGLTLVFKGDEKNIGAFADGKKAYRII